MSSQSKGMSAQIRKAMLDEELGDGDGEVVIEEPDAPKREVVIREPAIPRPEPEPHPPAPPPPTPPPAATSPELASLINALVTGITQANVGTAEAIKDALGNAASMARTPIPENAVDPGKSVYSHPDGDLKTPRTKLRCPMFLGIYDEEGKSKPAFEIFEDVSTEIERRALNLLEPGLRKVTRNDGMTATWRVVENRDDNDQPLRLVIAVPQTWLSQEQFQQMPGMPSFLRQLLVAQGSEDEWTQILLELQERETAAA